jgi:phosphopantothenoylcysteine decarboxylase/phosphopantothenate--cysteine ligase
VRLLITAGPTREHIDPVRFISNGSTGRLGYALATTAAQRGHDVVLVTGPVELSPPATVKTISVVSADEMLDACRAEFANCDAAIMTAAVADWRPASPSARKLPKPQGRFQLELEPTPDICAALGQMKGGRIVVGFALQDDDRHARAEEKMLRKHCDAIVLTSPAAIGAEEMEIEVKIAGQAWSAPTEGSKEVIAARLVDLVERLIA